MADLDKELESIEKGDAWNEKDEVVEVEVKKPLDKVIPVRLSAGAWTRLRREASELGVGPTTLARMWLLERLRSRQQLPATYQKRTRATVAGEEPLRGKYSIRKRGNR